MHKHNHCRHAMQYCEICDKAYCDKCGKEWGNRPNYYYPYWGGSYTVQVGETYTSDNSDITGVHSHK